MGDNPNGAQKRSTGKVRTLAELEAARSSHGGTAIRVTAVPEVLTQLPLDEAGCRALAADRPLRIFHQLQGLAANRSRHLIEFAKAPEGLERILRLIRTRGPTGQGACPGAAAELLLKLHQLQLTAVPSQMAPAAVLFLDAGSSAALPALDVLRREFGAGADGLGDALPRLAVFLDRDAKAEERAMALRLLHAAVSVPATTTDALRREFGAGPNGPGDARLADLLAAQRSGVREKEERANSTQDALRRELPSARANAQLIHESPILQCLLLALLDVESTSNDCVMSLLDALPLTPAELQTVAFDVLQSAAALRSSVVQGLFAIRGGAAAAALHAAPDFLRAFERLVFSSSAEEQATFVKLLDSLPLTAAELLTFANDLLDQQEPLSAAVAAVAGLQQWHTLAEDIDISAFRRLTAKVNAWCPVDDEGDIDGDCRDRVIKTFCETDIALVVHEACRANDELKELFMDGWSSDNRCTLELVRYFVLRLRSAKWPGPGGAYYFFRQLADAGVLVAMARLLAPEFRWLASYSLMPTITHFLLAGECAWLPCNPFASMMVAAGVDREYVQCAAPDDIERLFPHLWDSELKRSHPADRAEQNTHHYFFAWSWRLHHRFPAGVRFAVLALFAGVTYVDKDGFEQLLPSEVAHHVASYCGEWGHVLM